MHNRILLFVLTLINKIVSIGFAVSRKTAKNLAFYSENKKKLFTIVTKNYLNNQKPNYTTLAKYVMFLHRQQKLIYLCTK